MAGFPKWIAKLGVAGRVSCSVARAVAVASGFEEFLEERFQGWNGGNNDASVNLNSDENCQYLDLDVNVEFRENSLHGPNGEISGT